MEDKKVKGLEKEMKKNLRRSIKRMIQIAKIAEVGFKVAGQLYSNKTIERGLNLLVDGLMETDFSEIETELINLEKLKEEEHEEDYREYQRTI